MASIKISVKYENGLASVIGHVFTSCKSPSKYRNVIGTALDNSAKSAMRYWEKNIILSFTDVKSTDRFSLTSFKKVHVVFHRVSCLDKNFRLHFEHVFNSNVLQSISLKA